MSLLNPGKPRYGPGLGVAVARPLEAICKEVEEWNRRKSGDVEDAAACAVPQEKGASNQKEGGRKMEQNFLSVKGDLVGVGTCSRKEAERSSYPTLTDNQILRGPQVCSGQQTLKSNFRKEGNTTDHVIASLPILKDVLVHQEEAQLGEPSCPTGCSNKKNELPTVYVLGRGRGTSNMGSIEE